MFGQLVRRFSEKQRIEYTKFRNQLTFCGFWLRYRCCWTRTLAAHLCSLITVRDFCCSIKAVVGAAMDGRDGAPYQIKSWVMTGFWQFPPPLRLYIFYRCGLRKSRRYHDAFLLSHANEDHNDEAIMMRQSFYGYSMNMQNNFLEEHILKKGTLISTGRIDYLPHGCTFCNGIHHSIDHWGVKLRIEIDCSWLLRTPMMLTLFALFRHQYRLANCGSSSANCYY